MGAFKGRRRCTRACPALNSAYTAGIIKTRVKATMNTPANSPDLEQSLDAEDFDALDTILDDLRRQDDEVPQWEFCEGALAALLCTRRLILPSEFLPVLIGVAGEAAGVEGADGEDGVRFADAAQAERFMVLWTRRWNEVANALAAEIETLEDERSYHPELLDVRGAVATMPESDRADIAQQDLPAYGQVWALGFMFVVENWSDDWAAPRDKEAAQWLDDALEQRRRPDRRRHGRTHAVHAQRRRSAQRERSAAEPAGRGDLGGVRPAPDLAKPRTQDRARAPQRSARAQRPLLVRQWQKIQEVPRRCLRVSVPAAPAFLRQIQRV